MVIAIAIGYLDDIYGPQPHYYKNQIVIVDKTYQCPIYCDVNHYHHAYFEADSFQMIINKSELGKRVKQKKLKKK